MYIYIYTYKRIVDVYCVDVYVYVCMYVRTCVLSSFKRQVWPVCPVSWMLHREWNRREWNCIEAKGSTAEDSAKLIKVEVIFRFFRPKCIRFNARFTEKKKILSLPFPFLRHVTSLHALVSCICML